MNPTGATYAGKLALITGSRRGVGRAWSLSTS
jgi:3-oxoacyl-[acyl-carrier protein] reductase